MKVSVVVPVYNTGPYLERCIQSLVAQSLPADDYEVIFVDDGSTDGSPARLDELSASRPNMRVIHQPNSGWPGKPRNVGIDAARGTYVYFVDHDDALAPQALEHLYEFAQQNDSDIVIGKMAGHGRGAPRLLDTRPRVTFEDPVVMSTLTPHKMFRKAFLDEHGIRFPEGRRRLEDHLFVVTAYFAATVISIYAEHTCYFHLARSDRANAATGVYDPTGGFDAGYYYGFLREVLDVIEANTVPGPVRDRMLRRYVTRELLGRLRGVGFLASSPARRQERFDEIRAIVERYIPPTMEPLLPAEARSQLVLVRAGRLDLVRQLAEAEVRVGLASRVRDLRVLDGRRTTLRLEVELRAGREPLTFGGTEQQLLLPLPPEVADLVPDEARAIPVPIPGGVQVGLRRRRDSTEITLRPSAVKRLRLQRDGIRVIFDADVEIDADRPDEGFALRTGTWDVVVRLSFAGYQQEGRLRRPASLGRTRPVVLVDGEIASTHAAWRFTDERWAVRLARASSRMRLGRRLSSRARSIIRG